MAQRQHQGKREPTWEEKKKLKEAIEQNDTDLIQHMFQENKIGVNANIAPGSWIWGKYTALHYAVKLDKLHCVKLLIQLGADVTITDLFELAAKTPLQRAIDKKHSSIVYYFVKEFKQDISVLDQNYQQRIHTIIQEYEMNNPQRHRQELTTVAHNPDPSYYNDEPKMWDLIKIVIPKIKSEWRHVAYSMQYGISDIRGIENDCSDLATRCEMLFENWLSTPKGIIPKTWCTLLKCFRDVDELVAATEIIDAELKAKYSS